MANVKNFGLVGVGTSVQFGKAGPSLSKDSATVLRADGTAAFVMPAGTVAQRPTGVTGMLRFNDDADLMEFFDGSGWVTLATGGATVSSFQTSLAGLSPSTSQTGAVTLSGILGGASGGTGVNNGTDTITTEGNVNFGGTVTTGGNLTFAGANPVTITSTGSTSVTLPTSGTLLSTDTIADNAVTSISFGSTGLTPATATDGVVTVAGTLVSGSGGTGLSTFGIGSVLYASAANVWAAAVPGTTSGVQAWDADLDAIAALAGTGFAVRIAADTWAQRDITGTATRIVVTNGDGVASSPTIDLATVTNPGSGGSFVKITTDAYGRVSNSTAVVTADITSLVDATYVNVSGDSMSSGANLTFVGGGEVLGLPATPSGDTAATSKAYVDSVAAGLTWKTAVLAATTGNITLSGAQTIDGVSVVAGNRVLVRAQTTAADNGIYVAAAGAWTRATDADTPSDLDGAAVFVQQGTTLADTGWTQTATIVTVGTTPQTWVQFSGANAYVAGSGLDLSGNVFSVNVGAGITILPTDEVGIDVEAGKAVQLTGSLSASQLTFVLDGGAASGLEQSSSGLKISANGVTNAMILNDFVTFDADTGPAEVVTLGGSTFNFVGDAAQGVSSVVSTNQIQYTVQDATTGLKGVASFDTANFLVTAGAVSIKAGGIDLTTEVTGVLPVANGGTNVSSLVAQQILFGGAGGTSVAQDSDLSFNTTGNVLTLGTSTFAAPAAGDLTITATATNADINLVPNGTGAVIIGPSGAGLIQSDSGQPLTVRGNTVLTLESVSGDTTMALPTGTGSKVTISGPSASDYATGLTANDLVNKQYVDTVAGSAAGDVKAISATVNLASAGTTNIGAVLPAGATVLSVKVDVTAADTATGTLVVGTGASPSAYMSASENDTQSTGLYLAETMVVNSGVQVIATVGGTPGGAGSARVVVTYQIAE